MVATIETLDAVDMTCDEVTAFYAVEWIEGGDAPGAPTEHFVDVYRDKDNRDAHAARLAQNRAVVRLAVYDVITDVGRTDVDSAQDFCRENLQLKELRFFNSPAQVAAYVQRELVDTLEADLSRMEEEEYHQYTDGDREEMRNRIADIKAVIAAHPWQV